MKNNSTIGTLYIDSTGFDVVKFSFVPLDESIETVTQSYELPKRNTLTAAFLKKFLKSVVKGDFNRIAALAVQTGEGSFAGIRTGIALALGVGFAQDIPVYAIDMKGEAKLATSSEEIDYGSAPNIGITKKKILKQIK